MKYRYKTIDMKPDYEGGVKITIIANLDQVASSKAIIYIHGYIDYFFQDHLAEQAVNSGYNFYGVDLRKYGRSYIQGQHFNYCRSMDEYFEDITATIDYVKGEGMGDITLIGHSTGGLLAAIYASRGERKGDINRLLLNSPFLEFNAPYLKRKIGIPIANIVGKIFPYSSKSNELNPNYAKSICRSHYGQWEYNKSYKPDSGVPLYFAWLGAIYKAHREVKRGLSIECPVLIISSSRSANPTKWSSVAQSSDIVLNILHMERYASYLGRRVVYKQFDGAIHDLFLSKEPIREDIFKYIFNWLSNSSICETL